MKAQLLALLVLFACMSPTIAQDDVPTLANNEIGFNANTLVTTLIPFETENSLNSIENLIFFKTGKNDLKFRASLNFNTSNNSQDNSLISSSQHLLKVGLEKKTRLTKSWVFHTGAEAFYSSFKNTVETNDPFFGEFKSTTSRNRVGLDWVYGIQWVINNRFAIGTEGYIFLSYLEEKIVQEPNSINSGTDNGLDIGISLPQSILFSIYF